MDDFRNTKLSIDLLIQSLGRLTCIFRVHLNSKIILAEFINTSKYLELCLGFGIDTKIVNTELMHRFRWCDDVVERAAVPVFRGLRFLTSFTCGA